MVMELTIIPLGTGSSMSTKLAKLIKIIDASGMDYRMTAFGTMVEGPLHQLLDLIRRCHVEARKQAGRVLTMLRLDDFGSQMRELKDAPERVENKIGRPIRKLRSSFNEPRQRSANLFCGFGRRVDGQRFPPTVGSLVEFHRLKEVFI
jgi:uncharacterized protein (TIGR00106 family)